MPTAVRPLDHKKEPTPSRLSLRAHVNSTSYLRHRIPSDSDPSASIRPSANSTPANTMSDVLDSPLVLSLNRAWQVIGHRTVKQALIALAGGSGSDVPAALGIDIVYPKFEDGSWDFEQPTFLHPLSWDQWLALPIRDFDLVVNTPRFRVRVPTVIVATRFARMPVRTPRVSREAIFERDGGICQYTGERVGRLGGNLDHIVPRARGGRNTFENLVWAKREINSLKANCLPHEAGLRLLRRPRAPVALPATATIREARHPDWKHFLTV